MYVYVHIYIVYCTKTALQMHVRTYISEYQVRIKLIGSVHIEHSLDFQLLELKTKGARKSCATGCKCLDRFISAYKFWSFTKRRLVYYVIAWIALIFGSI